MVLTSTARPTNTEPATPSRRQWGSTAISVPVFAEILPVEARYCRAPARLLLTRHPSQGQQML